MCNCPSPDAHTCVVCERFGGPEHRECFGSYVCSEACALEYQRLMDEAYRPPPEVRCAVCHSPWVDTEADKDVCHRCIKAGDECWCEEHTREI